MMPGQFRDKVLSLASSDAHSWLTFAQLTSDYRIDDYLDVLPRRAGVRPHAVAGELGSSCPRALHNCR